MHYTKNIFFYGKNGGSNLNNRNYYQYKIKDANDLIQVHWEEVKLKLRLWWREFTQHDVAMLEDKTESLCALLRKRYGYTKERAEIEIKKFIKAYGWEVQH
ncbi:hypothetical protein [Candidatus Berkiella aquae]|uniref:CsbD-like domain-containing protein n=1 Tax=Candidatus Berkiella aquae TaxID=295108 RepID=A0A0Q9YME4_9GAMM|nr:hypothetical protein [Candidatus Berkiella aquae]MCS5710453.1 hypothetical protein [Candidatus Berkiella aquae]